MGRDTSFSYLEEFRTLKDVPAFKTLYNILTRMGNKTDEGGIYADQKHFGKR